MKTSKINKHILSTLNLEHDFKLTKQLLVEFGKLYSGKDINIGKPKEIRYNNKLSAMSLIKQKRLNGVPAKDIPEGFIYIVGNPAWEGYYKVGYSIEPHERLRQYQTGTPFADYKIRGWYLSLDVRNTEKQLHTMLSKYKVKGEWFKMNIHHLRKIILSCSGVLN